VLVDVVLLATELVLGDEETVVTVLLDGVEVVEVDVVVVEVVVADEVHEKVTVLKITEP